MNNLELGPTVDAEKVKVLEHLYPENSEMSG